jgi:putative oxidoreductase
MKERAVSKYAPYLYVLLRVVAGLLFACHGAQKLFGVFGGIGGQPGTSTPLFSLMGLAGCIELIGGLLIALGVLTSFAAFIASGEMAFAYFTQHFPRGFWPIQNGGELAVLYCFLFLYIAANGAGMWGVWRLRRDL